MIPMTLGKIAAAMGATSDTRAEAIDRRLQLPILRVTTDSRDIQPGDLFFAIRGDRFDGHRFLAEAASKGAVAGVVDNPSFEPQCDPAFPLLVVDNTISALGRLATYFRREVLPPGTIVIAMTGSNGKTTSCARRSKAGLLPRASIIKSVFRLHCFRADRTIAI